MAYDLETSELTEGECVLTYAFYSNEVKTKQLEVFRNE
jgi:hypothetical protein